jgi:hypothetical protein
MITDDVQGETLVEVVEVGVLLAVRQLADDLDEGVDGLRHDAGHPPHLGGAERRRQRRTNPLPTGPWGKFLKLIF